MSRKQGFSIVELIVVIVVIAIITTIAVVSYTWMRHDAVDARTEATVATIKKALEIKATKTGSIVFENPPNSKQHLLKDAYMTDLADTVDVYYRDVVTGNYGGKQKPVVDFTAINTGVLIMSYSVAKKQLVVDIIEQGYSHRQPIENERDTAVSYKPKPGKPLTCRLLLISSAEGWRAGNIRRVCKSFSMPQAGF